MFRITFLRIPCSHTFTHTQVATNLEFVDFDFVLQVLVVQFHQGLLQSGLFPQLVHHFSPGGTELVEALKQRRVVVVRIVVVILVVVLLTVATRQPNSCSGNRHRK